MSIKIEHLERYKDGEKTGELFEIIHSEDGGITYNGFKESISLTPTEFQELKEVIVNYKEI